MFSDVDDAEPAAVLGTVIAQIVVRIVPAAPPPSPCARGLASPLAGRLG